MINRGITLLGEKNMNEGYPAEKRVFQKYRTF